MDAQKSQTGYKNFDVERAQIAQNLASLKDKSTKGSIDEPMGRFLELINAQPDWITTSTCSGRLVSYVPGVSSTAPEASDQEPRVVSSRPGSVNGKGGGSWLFVTHSTLQASQLANPVETLFGASHTEVQSRSPTLEVWDPSEQDGGCSDQVIHFVYQPPVLHLLARSVAVAGPLLAAVIGAGFRNSGLTVGHRGRVMLAIRAATGGLDVPIAIKLQPSGASNSKAPIHLLLPLDYLAKLLRQGHILMRQNVAKLDRLFRALHQAFSEPHLPSPWECPDQRKLRMRAEGLALRAASRNPTAPTNSNPHHDHDFPQLSLLQLD
ncbi:hypothetical protein VP01_1428g1 [Puccinia sorghi]|uniref:tRNA wybutosine-synthesizing protein 3 n=1 Tax=Puccinia sorghi TaxID=27349 RepID=A0A0L6VL18_9BASI|nr:hypothetical protein VP01_1428g1 [Puccinia sorghi]